MKREGLTTALTAEDYRSLEARWITPELADAAKLERVDSATGREIVGRGHDPGDYSGILIPYFLPGSTVVREYRIRRDKPDLEAGSDGKIKERKKYVSPPGRGNLLYFPPPMPPGVLSKVDIPLVLTEGEFKALALWRLSIHASETPRFLPVGLGGVWNWRGTVAKAAGRNGGRCDVKGVIPDFDLISWAARRVIIAFDADERGNESVMRARKGLERELRNRGAKVAFLEWELALGKGIDDHIAAVGQEKVLEEIVAAWKLQGNGKATEGFRLVSLHDLFSEPEEKVAWIVQGRLPAGGFSILAGKPKAGKSTLARCLALAVAQGEPFLGWDTVQGPVIYLALEEKRSEVRAHFRAMGASGDEPIFIHAAQAPQDAVLALGEIVKEHEPRLIIVDPLLKFARVRSEKEYAEVSAALEPLLNLARESGAHLLAVYHSPKADRADLIDSPIGSTAFAAAVDTLLVLKRTKEYRTLATVQRCGSDLSETVLEFDSERRTTSLGAEKGKAEQERIGEAILEYLSGAGEAKLEVEIDGEVEGKTTHKRAALRELVKAEKVVRSGKGKSGDPYRYEVSFSCSLPIAGTREQDIENEGQPPENKQQCLVPDITGELQENPISREQDFLHSAEPEWEEGTL